MTACFKRFIFPSNILKNILKYILFLSIFTLPKCHNVLLSLTLLLTDNGICVKIVSLAVINMCSLDMIISHLIIVIHYN